MAATSNVIGWIIFIAICNYFIWSITGLTPAWGLLCQVGKPLSVYLNLANLGLVFGLVIGWAFYGPKVAIQCALVLIILNLVPDLAKTIFGMGSKCHG